MNEPVHLYENPINIFNYLPKYVLPEYTAFEDYKGFRICIKDMRDEYSFDCEVFMFDEKITYDVVKKHAWDYFFMLMREGVL